MANDPKSLGLVDKVTGGVLDAVGETGVGKALRAFNLFPGAERTSGSFTSASWDDEDEQIDWRVSLSLPNSLVPPKLKETAPRAGEGPRLEEDNNPLRPLKVTNNRLVFPYTPNIYITYSANYDNLAPTHSNYPFPIYQNSAVDQFVITGEFTVENSQEAEYWIAANHYLRTVTKMNYGVDANRGAPPPVVKLNGYGDFMFNDVPVVVQQYTVELGDAVDYIKADVGINGSWAPTRSTISVTLQPAFSRDSVNKFSLKKFAEGGYLNDPPGFI